MPIDFPSNPTNGQVYSNWIYDSSITAWRNVNTDTGIGTLNAMGLKNVVPTSVVVGSGSATTNANGTVTFSGATTVSLNGVFTSTYKNYKVLLKTSPSAASYGGAIYLKLRTTGTDYSLNYYFGGTYVSQGTMNTQNVSGAQLNIGLLPDNATDDRLSSSIEIFSPYESKATGYNVTAGSVFAGNNYNYNLNGTNISTNIFDGLTIIPGGSGNITGTIQVYGYTN